MKKIMFFFIVNITFFSFSEDFKKESWSIEWGELNGINLSLSNQFLVNTIPMYFKDNIQQELDHYFTKEESDSVLNHLKMEKIETLKSSLAKKIVIKDNFLFDKNYDEKKYNKNFEEINKLNNDLKDLINLNISNIDKFIQLPNLYLPKEKEELQYINDFQIKYYLEQNDIDYYISGDIEEVSDNLILTIKLYSKYKDEVSILWSGIGTSEEILGYRKEILNNLSKVIISDDIKPFTIDILPTDSLIYVNNVFRGLGTFTGFFLEGDILDIEISKEGYKSLEIKRVVNFLNVELSTELLPIENRSIRVITSPDSASAYYGSRFIGLTPISVPVFSYSQKLTLSLDGYMDKSLIIDSSSKDINIKLKYGIIDPEENLKNEKEEFYRATAIFSFSLAIPLYFSAQDDNIGDVLNNISIGHAVFWGINLFYRLYEYLKAAELSVE